MATETVKFDVGGTKYRVARSLIERFPETVLARMVSNTWQDDPDKEIFIERDGLRFSCVLDYMRDKKVHVPVNTTKASVLQDLEYFGFGEIPDDAIEVRSANTSVREHLLNLEKEMEDLTKSYRSNISALVKEMDDLTKCYWGEILAAICFKKYCSVANNQKVVTLRPSDLPKRESYDLRSDIFSGYLLNPYLKKYGLSLNNSYECSDGSRQVWLEELENE